MMKKERLESSKPCTVCVDYQCCKSQTEWCLKLFGSKGVETLITNSGESPLIDDLKKKSFSNVLLAAGL